MHAGACEAQLLPKPRQLPNRTQLIYVTCNTYHAALLITNVPREAQDIPHLLDWKSKLKDRHQLVVHNAALDGAGHPPRPQERDIW